MAISGCIEIGKDKAPESEGAVWKHFRRTVGKGAAGLSFHAVRIKSSRSRTRLSRPPERSF